MTLDTSGSLLEGTRVSTGNSPFTFPPKNLVSNKTVFDGLTRRSEYVMIVGSANPSIHVFDIADPELVFYWTRNDPTAVRFDYSSFSRRWLPQPGGTPATLGPLSNTQRLTMPIPDLTDSDAPVSLYIDGTPRVSFTLVNIGSSPFSSPSTLPQGTVEINSQGQLNFSNLDVAAYDGATVLTTGQSFFDRNRSTGNIGTLPEVSGETYRIFMNPRPASTQQPRIRIDYGSYLIPDPPVVESALVPPAPGHVAWSHDTGRVMMSTNDINANLGKSIYYDGVTMGSVQLPRTIVGSIIQHYPIPATSIPSAIGTDDVTRFIFFMEFPGKLREYFTTIDYGSVTSMSGGSIALDPVTGNVYVAAQDVAKYSGWNFGYVDALVEVVPDTGVSIRFYRSSVNSTGPSQVADFTAIYTAKQLVVDGMGQFPFVALPVTPIIDSALNFTVATKPGSVGNFVGALNDGTDSAKIGLGYLLDLDKNQMLFCNRKLYTFELPIASDTVKMDDSALSKFGLKVIKDGVLLDPSQYELDVSSGLVEFIEPIGEADPASFYVKGSISGDKFTVQGSVSSSVSGWKLFIESGVNAGLYSIVSISSGQITVSPSFISSEASVTASLRPADEVVADRFWEPVTSASKKFSLYKSLTGPSGPFTKMDDGEFAVAANVGQISLTSAAMPGEVFQIDYTSLDSPDEGVTVTPTKRIEMALFKIRQEAPSFTVGSNILTFNSAGKTVSTAQAITLYIDGVTQDATTFTFIAPGTIQLKDPIINGPVMIDYWVEDAAGGETTFNTLYSPIDYDSLKIIGPDPVNGPGQKYVTIGGDVSSKFVTDSVVMVDDREVIYVANSSYDSSTDITTVNFVQIPTADGTTIKVTGTIGFSYLVSVSNPIDTFVSGTNAVKIGGRISWGQGTIMTMDGDPYHVLSTSYDSTKDTTTITTSAPARKNYILATALRSVRPVYDPATSLATSKPASLTRGFTLVNMGTSRKVMVRGVDYEVADGGIITLKSKVGAGDEILAMYVARIAQPAGTVFEFNYAYAISPDTTNGLIGQSLTETYHLYAPDTFFYRTETIVSMLPEVYELLQQSSSLSSGPNTADQTSMQTKDFGLPSPWFDSQHWTNMDTEVTRLLQFYNDLVNLYEDDLSDIDGRIVGGEWGRFRFDGKTDNSPRDVYYTITNDIDDRFLDHYEIRVTGFFPSTWQNVPIYITLGGVNVKSRLFPMWRPQHAAFTIPLGISSGTPVGSFKLSNIYQYGTDPLSGSTKASAYILSSIVSGLNTVFTVDSKGAGLTEKLLGQTVADPINGYADALVPPFAVGEKATIYASDGTVGIEANVVAADATTVTLDTITSVQSGSLLQSGTLQRYIAGVDFTVDSSSGQLLFKVEGAVTPLAGEGVIECGIFYYNYDTKPLRFPALDGSEMNDSGYPPTPRLRRLSELQLLLDELTVMGPVGQASVFVTNKMSNVSITVSIGNIVEFIDGPNIGEQRTVTSVVGLDAFVSFPWSNLDVGGSSFIVNPTVPPALIVSDEILVLETNVADNTPTINPIKPIDSELNALNKILADIGQYVASGNGTATTSDQWNDPSVDFTGFDGYLIHVTGGSNRGLYSIVSSVGAHTVQVKNSDPWTSFPSVGVAGSYHVINPWSFLGISEFEFLTKFYRQTIDFTTSTKTWLLNLLPSGIPARVTSIMARRTALADFMDQLMNVVLKGDHLYDMRYSWINQRVNRKTGMAVQQLQAATRVQENLAKIYDDQQKALVISQLSTAVT